MKKFYDFKKMYEQEITLGSKETQSEQTQSQDETQVQSQDQAQPQPVNINSSQPEESVEEKSTDVSPVVLFSKLFEARQVTHEYHLQAKGEGSYAAHIALNDFYDGILGFSDELIETYQGQYGIIEEYKPIDNIASKGKEKVAYLEELSVFIKDQRRSIPAEDTHLHNIIDEVVALVYKTLYKLKNLK